MKFSGSAFTFLPATLLLADVLVAVTRVATAGSDPAAIGRTVLAALVYGQLTLLLVWAVLSRRRWWTRALVLVILYALAIVVLATPEIVLFATARTSAERNSLAGTSAERNRFLYNAWLLSFLGLAVGLLIMRRRGLAPTTATPDDCSKTGKPWQFSTRHLFLGLTYLALFIALVQGLHRARLRTILSIVVYTSFCVFYVLVACTALWATLTPGRTSPRLLLISAVPVVGGGFTAWMAALDAMLPAKPSMLTAPITPELLVPAAIFGVLYPCQIVVVLLLVRSLEYRLARHDSPAAARSAEGRLGNALGGEAILSRRRRLLYSVAGLVAVAAMGVAALTLGTLWLGESASQDTVTEPVQESGQRALASALNSQGINLTQQGQLPEAIRAYDKAIDIYSRLVEQDGRAEFAGDLAWVHNNRGAALLMQGKVREAIQDYDKTIEIYARLLQQKGHSATAIAGNLARGLNNRAAALEQQGQLPKAVRDYDNAIEIYIRLVEQQGRSELANYLAWSLSKRGLALAIRGQLPDAMCDYDKAIEIYTRLVEQQGRSELTGNLALALNNRGAALGQQRKLPEAVRDYDRAIEFYTRLVEQQGRSELAKDLAWTLNNRGIALAGQDKIPEAIHDLGKAIDIYTRLVEQQGRSELTNHLALVLNNLAWLHATHPDAQFRDGAKAVRDATHACELTSWKDFKMLDTLAAASAEQGDFDAATKWETTAIELAPEDQRAELARRRDLFQSRKRYRKP